MSKEPREPLALTYWQMRALRHAAGQAMHHERKALSKKPFTPFVGHVDLRVQRVETLEGAVHELTRALEQRWPGRSAKDDAAVAAHRAAREQRV